MFAKAAATVSNQVTRSSLYLDSYDATFIQYKAATMKLSEILKVLKILEASLSKNNSKNDIIPLMNIILALLQGPLFNISPIIKRRFKLLSELKLCKLTDIKMIINTTPVDISVKLPEVESDIEVLKCNIYDLKLQSSILSSIIKLVHNTLTIYSKKLNQLIKEIQFQKKLEINANQIAVNQYVIQDLLYPFEISICLDYSVLITNREKDTNMDSFHRLNLQILTKFKDHIHNKCLPPIKNYCKTIQKLTKSKYDNKEIVISELPHWKFTMHKIYAMLLRIKYLLDIIKAFLRQVYLPLKTYFHLQRTQLLSNNIHVFRVTLDKLDDFCFNDVLNDLSSTLQVYTKTDTVFLVEGSVIVNIYYRDVINFMHLLQNITITMNSFSLSWSYIRNNKQAKNTLDKLSDVEISKMLEERLIIDRLNFIENQNKKCLKKKNSILTANLPADFNGLQNPTKRINDLKKEDLILLYSSLSSTTGSSLCSSSPHSSVQSNSVWNSPVPLTTFSTISIGNSPKLTKDISESKLDKGTSNRPRSSSLQSSYGTKNSSDNKNQLSSLLPFCLNTHQNLPENNSIIGQKKNHGVEKSLNLNIPHETPPGKFKTSHNINPIHTSPYGSPLLKNNHPCELQDIKNLSLDEDSLIISVKESEQTTDPKYILLNDVGCDEDYSIELHNHPTHLLKKVRFIGVPPMTDLENPRPKKRGWYKKPPVLYYPSPPPFATTPQNRTKQEGFVFKNSLREQESKAIVKKSSYLPDLSFASHTASHKMSSKLRDKLIR